MPPQDAPAAIESFETFSAAHGITVLVILGVASLLIGVLRATGGNQSSWRGAVCAFIAALTLGGALVEQVYELSLGEWSPASSLPLHLCDLAIILVVTALFLTGAERRPTAEPTTQLSIWRQRCYELAYFWGLAGTAQALLTPDVERNFPHLIFFRFFLTHGGIVVGMLVMTLGVGLRPRRGSYSWVWVTTLTVAAFVYVVNLLIPGANYMYLASKPPNPSLMDYLGPDPIRQLMLVGVGSVLLWVVYLPYWLRDTWGVGGPKARASLTSTS